MCMWTGLRERCGADQGAGLARYLCEIPPKVLPRNRKQIVREYI